jgi:hypothetical protein
MSSHHPALVVRERAGSVRLHLVSLAHGDGPSLQEAADDLVRRVLVIARVFRTSGFSVLREVAHDVAALSLLYELDEIAATGGDVRTRLSSAPRPPPPAEQLAPPPAPVLDEDEQLTEKSGSATRTISVPRRHRGSSAPPAQQRANQGFIAAAQPRLSHVVHGAGAGIIPSAALLARETEQPARCVGARADQCRYPAPNAARTPRASARTSRADPATAGRSECDSTAKPPRREAPEYRGHCADHDHRYEKRLALPGDAEHRRASPIARMKSGKGETHRRPIASALATVPGLAEGAASLTLKRSKGASATAIARRAYGPADALSHANRVTRTGLVAALPTRAAHYRPGAARFHTSGVTRTGARVLRLARRLRVFLSSRRVEPDHVLASRRRHPLGGIHDRFR